MHKQRIELHMSMPDVIKALAEDTKAGGFNPGAIRVLTELLQSGPIIDQDAAFSGLAPLLDLDRMGVYASDIWLLYKDVCKENIVNVIAVLRAVQLGIISEPLVLTQINLAKGKRGESRVFGLREPEPFDLSEITKQVAEQLPNFAQVLKDLQGATA